MRIRQLSAGIDSLYWSSPCGIAAPQMAALKIARDSAGLTGTAQPWQETRGFALSVGPHGIHRYPVYVESHEFRVQVTDSKRLPTVYVQLRSAFIHEVGVEEAFGASVAVAEEIVGRAVAETNAARLDLYGDFADWSIRRADLGGLITNAKIVTHGRAGTDELETVMVGKSPMAVRLYRKDLEVRARGGFAPEFWGGYDGPVVRVEAQASREKLRELQVASVAECLACYGDVWAWATNEFVELRRPGRGAREQWLVRPEWGLVQALAIEAFPRCGLVPFRVAQGTRQKVVPALLGYLSSYGALENIREPGKAVNRLLAEFPELSSSPSRRFEDEVLRKRALLPRSYRLAQEGRRVAFARDPSPSPEGGDSESSTVGSDA